MTTQTHYDAALAFARLLTHKLDARPHMPRHERLAIATYVILEAIRAGADAAVSGRPTAWPDGENWS